MFLSLLRNYKQLSSHSAWNFTFSAHFSVLVFTCACNSIFQYGNKVFLKSPILKPIGVLMA